MDVLTIRGLSKRFGRKEVLRGLDLAIPEGSIFGFVGKNGAGKTTAMKAVLGLLPIDAGEITVLGDRVEYGRSATCRRVGYLPDVPEFYPFMTAPEYLRLAGESLGLSHGEITARSEELLALVGLADEKARIRGFSRGMKQRLGIAQALLGRPRLLLCDEPTSALDPIGRREILDLLRAVKNETTVLFSTHILSDVERICTDVALLDGGRIVLAGGVEELKRHRRTEELTVEMTDAEDTDRLLAAFPDARREDSDTLRLTGGKERILAVLGHIAEAQLSVRRIERAEPSLEALFLEVIGK